MMKTIEESVVEIIWEFVKHCYYKQLFPWQKKRELQQQPHVDPGAAGERRANPDADVYYALPLPIEETADNHDASHHAEIPQIHEAPPQPPPFERPSFLRNHVGLRLENDVTAEGRPQPSSVLIDRENRQVLLSQRALWTLIDLVPWADITNGRVQNSQSNQGGSHSLTQLAANTRDEPANRNNRAGQPRPSRTVSMITDAPNEEVVSTSLKVISAKCLSRIARFRLTADNKEGNHTDVGAVYEHLRDLTRSRAANESPSALRSGADSSLIHKLLRLQPQSVSDSAKDCRALLADNPIYSYAQSNNREIQTT